MKVWNFDGVDAINIGETNIKEVWLGSELIWKTKTPPDKNAWLDVNGDPHKFWFVWTWPNRGRYEMTMDVTRDDADTVHAAETVHYGTAPDGSGELFMIRTHDRENVFWVMVDGFERTYLWRQDGFPIRFKGQNYDAYTRSPYLFH